MVPLPPHSPLIPPPPPPAPDPVSAAWLCFMVLKWSLSTCDIKTHPENVFWLINSLEDWSFFLPFLDLGWRISAASTEFCLLLCDSPHQNTSVASRSLMKHDPWIVNSGRFSRSLASKDREMISQLFFLIPYFGTCSKNHQFINNNT